MQKRLEGLWDQARTPKKFRPAVSKLLVHFVSRSYQRFDRNRKKIYDFKKKSSKQRFFFEF